MPLGTIDSMAKSRLSYIPDTVELDNKIASKKTEAFYLFQTCLGKDSLSDEDLELDESYSSKQKIFISAYTAYMVAAEDLSSSQGAGSNKIKKAKADVVEVGFQTSKESGELSKTGVVSELRREACSYGKELGCCPAICADFFPVDPDGVIPPLLFHETLRPEE